MTRPNDEKTMPLPSSPDAFPWPPEFAVRVSARAKYARLRVLPGKGLEVVLPRNMAPETATRIVERHREWICKTLGRVCGGQCKTVEKTVPERIFFRGGSEERLVLCVDDPPSGNDAVVRLRSSRREVHAALRELQDWTRCHAALVVGAETTKLAEQYGLPFTALRFRRQKSRWGSCTAKGALSLNTCLVFLPPELARHVILHELAHTQHLDHGRGFWKTLFAMEPDALKLDKRLRTAWRFVPAWIWA